MRQHGCEQPVNLGANAGLDALVICNMPLLRSAKKDTSDCVAANEDDH